MSTSYTENISATPEQANVPGDWQNSTRAFIAACAYLFALPTRSQAPKPNPPVDDFT